MWLIVPGVGVPGAIVSGVIALLARKGRTRLSNMMASVAVVLGIAEGVYIWLAFG